MFDEVCVTSGCDEKANGRIFSGRCLFHDVVSTARELAPEAFVRLRETLATTVPINDEERRARHIRSSLRTLEWTSRDYKRAIDNAKKAGATDEQIVTALDALSVTPPAIGAINMAAGNGHRRGK